MDHPFTPEMIQAEHDRLGHKLGWRFLYGPQSAMKTATTAVISLNPGGDTFEEQKWSCENGSAYVTESWKGKEPGRENHQVQIGRMLDLLGLSPDEVLAGVFVPFRSPGWDRLNEKRRSVDFGRRLWSWALGDSRVNRVITIGQSGSLVKHVCTLLDCRSKAHEAPVNWGNLKLRGYTGNSGRTVVSIPHVSRFPIFGRPESDPSFRNLVEHLTGVVTHKA